MGVKEELIDGYKRVWRKMRRRWRAL